MIRLFIFVRTPLNLPVSLLRLVIRSVCECYSYSIAYRPFKVFITCWPGLAGNKLGARGSFFICKPQP
jgi:hypothetical protein